MQIFFIFLINKILTGYLAFLAPSLKGGMGQSWLPIFPNFPYKPTKTKNPEQTFVAISRNPNQADIHSI